MKYVNLERGEQASLFTSIAIEISSKCNRTCEFCPNGSHDREDVEMPMATIERILGQLSALKYSGRIEFYIYNEPTRDKRLVDILKRTRTLVPRACLMISTNGDYFRSAADIAKLYDAGLNQMQINIYSHQRRMDTIRGWVDGLQLDQTSSVYQNVGAKKRVCKVVAKFHITKATENKDLEGVNHLSNRSGNIPDFRNGLTEPLHKGCTRPFRFLNINYKGDGLLCCNDYYGEMPFGNVAKNTLTQIWNHPTLISYRLKLQAKDRSMPLCDVCDFGGGAYTHMVDTYAGGEKHLKKHRIPKVERLVQIQ